MTDRLDTADLLGDAEADARYARRALVHSVEDGVPVPASAIEAAQQARQKIDAALAALERGEG